jgi:hypothetical protein
VVVCVRKKRNGDGAKREDGGLKEQDQQRSDTLSAFSHSRTFYCASHPLTHTYKHTHTHTQTHTREDAYTQTHARARTHIKMPASI